MQVVKHITSKEHTLLVYREIKQKNQEHESFDSSEHE